MKNEKKKNRIEGVIGGISQGRLHLYIAVCIVVY